MSFIRVRRNGEDTDHFFPACQAPALGTHQVSSAFSRTRMSHNRLVATRQHERVLERLSRVKPKPHTVASAVSRYSSQNVPLGVTPSTPPSPDVPEEPEDLLSLGRTVKRRRIENPLAVGVLKLVRNSESSRLSSIKT